MACATLKRPLEWSDPSMSPPPAASQSSPSTSSSTAAASGQSPMHHHGGGHQSGLFGNGFGSIRPAKRRCLGLSPVPSNKMPSPFGVVQPDDVANSIKEEMMRLYHRKKLNAQQPSSPNGSGQVMASGSSCSQDCSSVDLPAGPIGLSSPSRRDAPLFTFRQVELICERLLKEREAKIRLEYDQVLAAKLAEQYDTFVKFTYDQIQKRFESGSIPSYLS